MVYSLTVGLATEYVIVNTVKVTSENIPGWICPGAVTGLIRSTKNTQNGVLTALKICGSSGMA